MVSRFALVSDGQDQHHISRFVVFIKRNIPRFATGDDEFAKVVLHQAAYFRVLFQNGQCIQYQIDGFNRVFSLMGPQKINQFFQVLCSVNADQPSRWTGMYGKKAALSPPTARGVKWVFFYRVAKWCAVAMCWWVKTARCSKCWPRHKRCCASPIAQRTARRLT